MSEQDFFADLPEAPRRAPRTKPGVRLEGVRPELVDFAARRDFTITSGADSPSVHAPRSRHARFGAIDLRTHDKTPEQIAEAIREAQRSGLRATYERKGQGRATGDHIHLEASDTDPADDFFSDLPEAPAGTPLDAATQGAAVGRPLAPSPPTEVGQFPAVGSAEFMAAHPPTTPDPRLSRGVPQESVTSRIIEDEEPIPLKPPAPSLRTQEGRAARDVRRQAEREGGALYRIPVGKSATPEAVKTAAARLSKDTDVPQEFVEKWLKERSAGLYERGTNKPLESSPTGYVALPSEAVGQLRTDYRASQGLIQRGLSDAARAFRTHSPGEVLTGTAGAAGETALRAADLATRPIQGASAAFWTSFKTGDDRRALQDAMTALQGEQLPESAKNPYGEAARQSEMLRGINPNLPAVAGFAGDLIDPTNMIPAGLVAKGVARLGKGAAEGSRLARVAEGFRDVGLYAPDIPEAHKAVGDPRVLGDLTRRVDTTGAPLPDVPVTTPSAPRIIRHADPRIDGGEVVGKASDGRLKVKNNEGGVSLVKNPRTQGNRDAAIVRTKGEANAQEVRIDTGQPEVSGQVRQSGENVSRQDLQRNPPGRVEAGDEQITRGQEEIAPTPPFTDAELQQLRAESTALESKIFDAKGEPRKKVNPTDKARWDELQTKSAQLDAYRDAKYRHGETQKAKAERVRTETAMQKAGVREGDVVSYTFPNGEKAEGPLKIDERGTFSIGDSHSYGANFIEGKGFAKVAPAKEAPKPEPVPLQPPTRPRAFPKSAERAGLSSATDRTYSVVTDKGAHERAQKRIAERGADKVEAELTRTTDVSKDDIVAGEMLARKYNAEGNHEAEVAVINDLAEKLTRAGQTVQAASLIARLSPEGVLLAGQRVLNKRGVKRALTEVEAAGLKESAAKVREAEAKVASLEQQLAEAKTTAPRVPRPKVETLTDRLTKLETEARARLAARQQALQGPKGSQAGASSIPLDIADYAIIGAAKLARKGVDVTAWTADMVREFGDGIKPHLKAIYKQSYAQYDAERKSLLGEREVRGAVREVPGPQRPEDTARIIEQRVLARKEARTARAELAKQFRDLSLTRRQKVGAVVADALNVPRTLKSSIDLSAAGRQAAIYTVTHPVKSTRLFFGRQLKAMKEKNFDRYVDELESAPDFQRMRKAKLELSTVAQDRDPYNITQREEAFLSRIAGYVPGVRQSERAYTTFLDSARVDWFRQLAKHAEQVAEKQGRKLTPEDDAKIADFVNIATGRGNVGEGKIKAAMPILNAFFFAPRYAVSKLQVLNPAMYAKLPKGARKVAAAQAVAYYGTIASTAMLLKYGLGLEVGTDPESSEFMKLKVGNTRYDLTAGQGSYITFLARMGRHAYNRATDTKEKFGRGAGQTLDRFVRYKYGPVAAALRNTWEGKNAIGEKTSAANEAFELIKPIYLGDLLEAFQKEGMAGVGMNAPGLVGIGVNTYEERPKGRASR